MSHRALPNSTPPAEGAASREQECRRTACGPSWPFELSPLFRSRFPSTADPAADWDGDTRGECGRYGGIDGIAAITKDFVPDSSGPDVSCDKRARDRSTGRLGTS
jgi:hypothetical protein